MAKRAEEFTNSAESDELLMVYVTRAVSMTREGGRYAYVGCIDADRRKKLLLLVTIKYVFNIFWRSCTTNVVRI